MDWVTVVIGVLDLCDSYVCSIPGTDASYVKEAAISAVSKVLIRNECLEKFVVIIRGNNGSYPKLAFLAPSSSQGGGALKQGFILLLPSFTSVWRQYIKKMPDDNIKYGHRSPLEVSLKVFPLEIDKICDGCAIGLKKGY